MNRWDETWHRLLEWTSGQAPSERLSAQVLAVDGFSSIVPSHPLGGKDGGRDATCKRGDEEWVMAVYFPRGPQSFPDIRKKFLDDVASARSFGASRVAFVTNQELRLAERKNLKDLSQLASCELYELERITAILDRPDMGRVRQQFLGIGDDSAPVQVADGGKGGSAPGAGGGGGAAIGPNARGGPGGQGGDFNGAWPAELLPFLSRIGAPGAGGGGGASATPAMALFDYSSLLAEALDQAIPLGTPIAAKGGDGGSAGPVPPARAVEQRDIDAGLRLAVFAPADLVQVRAEMINALSLGWEYCSVPSLPCDVAWNVACVFSRPRRTQEESSVIGVWIVVQDPDGNEVSKEPLLLFGDSWTAASRSVVLRFVANMAGTWILSACSGVFCLARFSVEIRSP